MQYLEYLSFQASDYLISFTILNKKIIPLLSYHKC